MSRRKRKPVTATLSAEALERIAAEVSPGHAGWRSQGYRLAKGCRLWRRTDGTWTIRFVYQDPADKSFSFTAIVKGVVFA
ncbi:hypothetical protein [Jiella pacifica]|uniref:Uncharacterized protein n=1 Tax=Jiella pacifica TaxID=2696469 RepID=A0A6N9T0E0_9HYPH|nr:hypothetical protein [Jiella pacifica]NDW04052.1 hypothetical protein [Jiella pacifica]